MNVRLNNLNSLERQESFGKKNKKADEKQSYTSQPQTGVSKKLKHGFVGAGLALASLLGMSSCVEQSQYMDPPDLDWLKEYLDVTNEKLDQIIENQEEGNSYKAQILEELKKIYEEQKLTNANMEIFRKDLMDLLEQFGIENSQFRAEILEILNNQNMSTQEKYDKIIELMQQIGDKLDKLDSIQNSIDNLEQTVSVGNDKLANLIKEAILEFKDGNLTLQELNLQIAEWVANSNLQNQEVIKKMNQIIEKIEAGQVSEDAALSQIAALLQTISDDVKDIANQLKNLAALVESGDKQLSQDIKDLTAAYEQGNADLNTTLQAILERAEQQCTNDATIIAEIQEIKDKIESGEMSSSEALNAIKDILNTINTNIEVANEKLDAIVAKLGDMDSTLKAKLDALIAKYEQGSISQDELLSQILAEATKSNQIASETLQEIKNISNNFSSGQISMTEALNQIAALLQVISEDVKAIAEQLKKLAALIESGDKQLSQDIKNLTATYEQGNADLNTTLNAILDRAEQQCTNDATIISEIREIKDKLAAGQIDYTEALNAIKDILNSINANIEAANQKIDSVISKLGDLDTNLGSKLDALINQYEQGSISQEELLSQILAQTIQSNQISTDILTEVRNIKAQYEAGNIDLTTALDKLTQLVQDIKDISQETLDTLKQLAADFNAYRTENDTNLKNLGSQLGQVISGVGNIEQQLENLNKTADAIYGSTTKLGTTIDNIYAELGNIKNEMGSGLTKEELEEIIASKEPELFQAYQQMLDVIAQGNTKLDNIIDIMSAFSGFGDKLDGMSEKVSQLIALMQTSNQTQLDNATNIINEIKNLAQGGTANTDAINAKLDEAIGILGDMKELLEQISSKLSTVITNQEAHQERADSYMTQSIELLTEIAGKMVTGDDFSSLLTRFSSYVDQTQAYQEAIMQDNQEFKELLRELIAQQGGGSGLTREELVSAIQEGLSSLNIPNYTDVLDSINKKLDDIFQGLPEGTDITLEALEQLFQRYQSNADLSLTNELLDQILTVTGQILNNSSQGGNGGSMDTSALQSILQQVIEAIRTGDSNSITQIGIIQETLNQVLQELQRLSGSGSGETAQFNTRSSSVNNLKKAMAKLDNYNAYASLIRAEYKANDGQAVRSASAGKYRPDTFYWRV